MTKKISCDRGKISMGIERLTDSASEKDMFVMIGAALACGWVDIKNLHPYSSKIWGDLSINLSAFISLSARLHR